MKGEKQNVAEDSEIDFIKVIKDIKKNYQQEEKSIVEQLYFQHSKHGTTIGGFREDVWKEMFEQIIPKKFAIEQSVFLIDSNGKVSKEVDLAIFDEMYTPYIFKKGRLKFIPIEAVAVVVECKSSKYKSAELVKWSDSISLLKTSRNSIVRIQTGIATQNPPDRPFSYTQTSTRPIKILCCLRKTSFKEDSGILKKFDIVIRGAYRKVEKIETPKLEIDYPGEKNDLKSWFQALNHSNRGENDPSDEKVNKNMGKDFIGEDKKGENGNVVTNHDITDYRIMHGKDEISLMSLNFQLNQLLMLINNPMFFPHKAYVDLFNDYKDQKKEE